MPDPATGFHGWWRPTWYPNQDPAHNPWATDPATYQQGHETFYQTWVKTLPAGRLLELIREHREAASA